MIQIEVRGIPCVFNENPLNDADVLEIIAEIDQGNILKLPQFFKAVFGEEQYSNIKDSLRDDDGICRVDVLVSFYQEAILEAAKVKKADAKN